MVEKEKGCYKPGKSLDEWMCEASVKSTKLIFVKHVCSVAIQDF